MMARRKRTPKQQARFDAATARAVKIARERTARLRPDLVPEPPRWTVWTTWELQGSFYVLEWLSGYYSANYGTPETWN